MFYKEGSQWKINKLKITYQAVTYQDSAELYPGAKVEPVTLTPEQMARFVEIRDKDVTPDELLAYVMGKADTLPDHRGEAEQLVDLLPLDVLERNATLIGRIVEKLRPERGVDRVRNESIDEIIARRKPETVIASTPGDPEPTPTPSPSPKPAQPGDVAQRTPNPPTRNA